MKIIAFSCICAFPNPGSFSTFKAIRIASGTENEYNRLIQILSDSNIKRILTKNSDAIEIITEEKVTVFIDESIIKTVKNTKKYIIQPAIV